MEGTYKRCSYPFEGTKYLCSFLFAVGGSVAGVCHKILVASLIVLISGRAMQEGPEGARKLTIGSASSTTSSAWIPRFCATPPKQLLQDPAVFQGWGR